LSQQPLFPVQVKSLIPNPFPSADMQHFAVGADGHDYAVKAPSVVNPELAATEYLCYCLAASCQLAVPATANLKMLDGTEAFGSRFEGGVEQVAKLSSSDQQQVLASCAKQLTTMLTMDVFVCNDDRHWGNFLARKSPLTGTWTIVSIDYSRAMWISGFPNTPPSQIASVGNTGVTIQIMKNLGYWDQTACNLTASSLSAVTPTTYQNWLNVLPITWHTQRVTESAQWWNSNSRASRITNTLSCL
jgi:hypothetical protein